MDFLNNWFIFNTKAVFAIFKANQNEYFFSEIEHHWYLHFRLIKPTHVCYFE